MTRRFLPRMVEENQGHIINMGSTAGIYAYAGAAVYAATKAAVKFLSDGIRIDTIEKNIKVSTIQPGIVETDFSQVRFHGDKERADTVYKIISSMLAVKKWSMLEKLLFIMKNKAIVLTFTEMVMESPAT